MMERSEKKIDRLLVGITGSIAVLNLPTYLTMLRVVLAKELKVVMTQAATRLMPASSVALLCDEVFLDQGSDAERKTGHVDLGRWCDMFAILPASADVLGQAANGLAPNLLTTTILASNTPVVFYPNMNAAMRSKRAVQRNVESLREDGHIVVLPELVMGHEIASGQPREGWTVPEPDRVIQTLREIYGRPEFSAGPRAPSIDEP
jgi:phosphopantothenoylcysteine synthetase/decarboxylase